MYIFETCLGGIYYLLYPEYVHGPTWFTLARSGFECFVTKNMTLDSLLHITESQSFLFLSFLIVFGESGTGNWTQALTNARKVVWKPLNHTDNNTTLFRKLFQGCYIGSTLHYSRGKIHTDQHLTIFCYKGPDSKYFRLCQPQNTCHNN